MVTKEELLDLFEYKDGNLYWKIKYHGITYGSKAGAIGKKYCQICIKRKKYYLHRLIWIMFNGNIPDDMEIDHIDGNGLNNNIFNLRVANSSQNKCNSKKRITNSCGFKGVSLHKKSNKFYSRIQFDKKVICLGYFDTAEKAHEAYENASKKYHGNFGRIN